jgi:hypothetical protein
VFISLPTEIGGLGSKTQFHMQALNDIFTAATSGGVVGDIEHINSAIKVHDFSAIAQSGLSLQDKLVGVADATKQIRH